MLIKRKLTPILIGSLLLAFFLWFEITEVEELVNVRQRLELLAYDVRLRLTLDYQPEQDKRVVIVDIDEKSLRKEGRWPWTRAKMASLIENLYQAGAVVVAFDIMFSEAERNDAIRILETIQKDVPEAIHAYQALKQKVEDFDNDRIFARSLLNRDVVLGYIFHRRQFNPIGLLPKPLNVPNKNEILASSVLNMESYTANLPVLQAAARHAGFFSLDTDPDGIIRRVPLVIRHKDNLYPSLALEAVRLFQLVDKITVYTEKIGNTNNITGISLLPGKVIRTDGEGRAIIPFRGPFHSFPYVSATDVLSGKFTHKIFENTIVLVGTTAEGLFDLRAVPMQSVYPGVEVHANLISGMLDNQFPVEPPWSRGANFILMLGLGAIIVIALPLISPLLQLLVTAVLGISLLIFNVWTWNTQGYVIAVALPLLMIFTLAMANLGYGFLFEAQARRFLKRMFGQYVPPELVEEMSENPTGYGFEGDSRDMTVLFADVVGFTTISETLSAAEVKHFLNNFFTPMTKIIFNHRGTIDKYVGDMVMAFWGAPIHDKYHALNAVDTAIDMIAKTEELKSQFKQEGLPEIDICVGINSGVMNVGDMGSEYRRAYTVLGDAVNLASRLEASSRYYGVSLVVGEQTYEQIKDDYVCRILDKVKVKGKTQPVWVYEPICRKSKMNSEVERELNLYHAALDLYQEHDFTGARALFHQLRESYTYRKIYDVYLERFDFFMRNPPGPGWDGAFERRTK